MIKEWIRNFVGYDLLKDICDDIRRDISNLYGEMYTTNNNRSVSKLSQLKQVCEKADLTNQDAIKFILHHLDISEDVFQEYKYFEYEKTPWYIKELFLSKYGIVVKYEFGNCRSYLYYKEHLIGVDCSSHMGKLLDNIEKIDKESLNELSDK